MWWPGIFFRRDFFRALNKIFQKFRPPRVPNLSENDLPSPPNDSRPASKHPPVRIAPTWKDNLTPLSSLDSGLCPQHYGAPAWIACKVCEAIRRRVRVYGSLVTDLYLSQRGRCAICDVDLAGQRWAVDHDHDHCPKQGCTSCIRGLLCPICNMGIGALKDSPTVLRNAIDYLESWQGVR